MPATQYFSVKYVSVSSAKIISAGLLFLTAFAVYAIEGPPITDNQYSVDLGMGPVVGSSRMVGLGGAYVGVAEGADGMSVNPASILYYHKKGYPRWRPGFTFGVFKALGKDFDNNGSAASDFVSHLIIEFGLTLQHGRYGLGFYVLGQPIEVQTGTKNTEFSFSTPKIIFGRSFLERQLNLALAITPAVLEAKDLASGTRLFELDAAGFEIGSLWHPGLGRLRLGLTYRGRTSQEQPLDITAGPVQAAGLFVPKEVELPWQLSSGASYVWSDILGGRKLLVSGQLNVIGKARADNAYGIESFLEQKVQRHGIKTVVSPRLGAEIEVFPKKLRSRIGSYYEPSRFEGVSGRFHATGGLEWSFSKRWTKPESSLTVQYAFDISRSYSKHSLSVNIWRF